MMEEVKCNLCGQDNFKVVFKNTPSGRIVQCKNCGLVYAHPRKKEALIREVVVEEKEPKEVKEKWLPEYIKEKSWIQKNFDLRLKLLLKLVPRKGRLLDIGSHLGFFLEQAKKYGFDVLGLEPSEIAARYAIQKLGINTQIGTLDSIKFPPNYFDTVTLFHTIEHLADPDHTIGEINRILKKDGLLVIETPNIENIWVKIFRSKWRQFLPNHFYFFSKETLSKLLEKNGFKVFEVRTIGKIISLDLLAVRIEEHISKILGLILRKIFKFLSLDKIAIRLDIGDIIIVLAKKIKDL